MGSATPAEEERKESGTKKIASLTRNQWNYIHQLSYIDCHYSNDFAKFTKNCKTAKNKKTH